MKRALINIDYTYDFVAEKGALTCGKPGQEIEKEIVHITKQYIENGDYVVFAIDKHEENDVYHPESKLFPPHNIAGTNGRDLFGELQEVYETYKNAENVYYMDKTRYSAFAGTDL
ncbi:cysteine hydrolase, partial [Bacillus wiedmannii]